MDGGEPEEPLLVPGPRSDQALRADLQGRIIPDFAGDRELRVEDQQVRIANLTGANNHLTEAQRARITVQVACSFVLLLSCCGATALILSETVQGIRHSLYCRWTAAGPDVYAPVECVAPLTLAAVACHVSAISGLMCIARFAWKARDALASQEEQRRLLRVDLKQWRGWSAKVLFAAGVIFIIAGAPCAGLAHLAFIFLATGFLMLYATALFFDDDFEQAMVPPRFIWFLGVYVLVGITFTALSGGVMEWLDGRPPDHEAAKFQEGNLTSRLVSRIAPFQRACTDGGQLELAPRECTVPLGLLAGISLWWAASPLFSVLLLPRSDPDGDGVVRRILQRWRHRIDWFILTGIGVAISYLHHDCAESAPIAFEYARVGLWTVLLLVLLRRISPLACDGWRGPLEHLQRPRGDFSMPQCSICLGDLQAGDDVCRTPCDHDFHHECLEDWVLSSRYRSPGCPLCREPISLPSAPGTVRW